MQNNNTKQHNSQQNSRRDLLEQTKLSRLMPNFVNTPTKTLGVIAVCAGCNTRLDLDDQIQQTFTGCRRCVLIYSRLDAAFDENSKRKKKAMLEKMGGAR
jgi:hypothetical protein